MPKAEIKTEPYRDGLLLALRNPDEAAEYLNACLEDGDLRVFLLALRDVADARLKNTAPSGHGSVRR
jgi:DNA-binding phage protein